VEHEAEYEKLTQRGSDYEELLRMGEVVAVVDDTDVWRDEIRKQARADRIKVRTGASNHEVAWAYLKHRSR
jgi:hypothetical protein